jgi:hypothetical protein
LSEDAARAELLGNILRDNRVQISLDGLPKAFYCDYNNLGGGRIGALGWWTKYATLEDWRKATGADGESISGDPLFVNAEQRDFRLTPTSICRGRGFLAAPIGAGAVADVAATGLQFVDVRVLAVSPTTADLYWESRGRPSTVLVSYGTDPSKLDQLIVRDTGHFYRTRHTFTLTGLRPGTRYFFRVGDRQLLEGGTPYHAFNYSWPELTPAGEEERYQKLKKEDTFDTRALEFVTPQAETPSDRTYYVAGAGDDAAEGTEAKPFRNIWRACQQVTAGDRVVVRAGTYHDSIAPLRSGTPEHPITFEAARGERVVISGKRLIIPTGADLTSKRHIVVRGFFFCEQAQNFPNDVSTGAQAYIVDASNIRIERCVFDGRMQYLFASYVYRSRDITFENNVVVSHWSAIIATDNLGILDIRRNSFIGPTIHKLYGPRNDRVVLRGNIFDENLFPKKSFCYKVVLIRNKSVDMDYNCYYFDPKNTDRRCVDYGSPTIDVAGLSSEPRPSEAARIGISGDLTVWQEKFGQDRHSIIADPKWKNPKLIEKLRDRDRLWPNRFFTYPDFDRADVSVLPDSPCSGKGEGGADMGPDHSY